MSIRRPALSLTVGGQSLDGAEAAAVELRVDLSVGPAHDRVVCAVGLASPLVGTTAGSDIEVSLGYDDAPDAVMAGTVSAVERMPWGAFVEGLAASATLSSARLGRSYVSQSAADVASDLVTSAGGSAGEVSCQVELAAFHVDERRTVWSHLLELARLTGSELSCDAQGGVAFRPVQTGTASHTLRHGAEVIAWQVGSAGPGASAPAVTVVPFGAGSEQGADHWHILLRAPEGSSPSGPVLVPAALRDRSGAQTLEQAFGDADARRGTLGTLTIVGDASIRPGDLVELTGMPSGEDGTYRALSVTHRVGDLLGFRSRLRVEGAT